MISGFRIFSDLRSWSSVGREKYHVAPESILAPNRITAQLINSFNRHYLNPLIRLINLTPRYLFRQLLPIIHFCGFLQKKFKKFYIPGKLVIKIMIKDRERTRVNVNRKNNCRGTGTERPPSRHKRPLLSLAVGKF